MSTSNDITSLYVGYFNRAPDPVGLNFWIEEVESGAMTLDMVAQSFSVQPEATNLYPYLAFPNIVSPEAFLESVYQNLFNRSIDDAGREFWVGELESGNSTVGSAILNIISGASGPEADPADLATLENKIEAGAYFTTEIATNGITYFEFDEDGVPIAIDDVEDAAKDAIDGVTDDDSTVASSQAATDSFVDDTLTEPPAEANFFLSNITGFNPVTGEIVEYDNIVGTGDNDTIYGEPGDFNTGDRIDGNAGVDEIVVVMDRENFDQDGSAVSAVTTDVEHLVVTMQAQDQDEDADNNIDDVDVNIDGGRMVGVTRWEDYDSRADLIIEDARDDTPEDGTFTAALTVAMVSTDPGNVDYAVYFDDPVNTGQADDAIFIRAIDQDNSTIFDENQAFNTRGQDVGSLDFALLSNFSFFYAGDLQRIDLLAEFFELDSNGDPIIGDDGVPVIKPGSPNFVGDGATYVDLRDAIRIAAENQLDEAVFNDLDIDFEEGATFRAVVGTNSDEQGDEEFVYGPEIVIRSESGQTLEPPAFAGIEVVGFGQVDTDVFGSIAGEQDFIEDCIRVNIVLDDVGKSSAGGDLVVGAMSTGTQDDDPRKSDSIGIQCFDIFVDRESNLQTINSTNNSLEEVTIASRDNDTARGDSNSIAGRDDFQSGDLIVRGGTVEEGEILFGSSRINDSFEGGVIDDNDNEPMPGAAPQHNIFGFSDVRVIDASALNGAVDLTAELTDEIVEKYLDQQDRDRDNDDDDDFFTYDLTRNDDEFLLNMSAVALTGAGTGAREDFNLDISGGAGNDWITTNVGESFKVIDGQGQDWFGMSHLMDDTASGYFDELTVDGGSFDGAPLVDVDEDNVPDWYENHSGQDNADTSVFNISGGADSDAIWTYGYGDYRIDAGTGNDIIYSDNSGISWLANGLDLPEPLVNAFLDRPVTTPDRIAENIRGDHEQIDYAINAVWTFNDDNGENGEGNIADVVGQTNDIVASIDDDTEDDDWYVTVTFVDDGASFDTAYYAEVEIDVDDGDTITELDVIQGAKDVILGDEFLDAVLEVQDGPGNSLLVWTKIDGEFNFEDLEIGLQQRDDTTDAIIDTWNKEDIFDLSDAIDGQGLDFQQFGGESTALTNSKLIGGANNDVISMSSSQAEFAAGTAAPEQMDAVQTLFMGSNFGNDTVIHFDTDEDNTDATEDGQDALNDIMRITAFGSDGDWDDYLGLVGGVGNGDEDSIALWDDVTLAQAEDAYSFLNNGQQAVAIVYDSDALNNIGTFVYLEGVGGDGDDADATVIGSVNLVGTDWLSLGDENFFLSS